MKNKNYQEKRNRVAIIVIIQIVVIISSFAIISQFTIESEFLGNSINLSGSNRLLGEILFHSIEHEEDKLKDSNVYSIISTIDTNIFKLENGSGDLENSEVLVENIEIKTTNIKKVPTILNKEFEQLQLAWTEYKNCILDVMNNGITTDNIDKVTSAKTDFINGASNLTMVLSDFSAKETTNLFRIQISLLLFNIFTHILLLYLVFRILTNEQKMEKDKRTVIEKNKTLIERLEELIIKNNSSQITSALFIEELKQAEMQTKETKNLSEEQKIDYFWNRFFKNIENKIKDVEKEKIIFENKKSYYHELNKKFQNSIKIIHENKNKKIGKQANNNIEDFFDSLSEIGIISNNDSKKIIDFLHNKTEKELNQK